MNLLAEGYDGFARERARGARAGRLAAICAPGRGARLGADTRGGAGIPGRGAPPGHRAAPGRARCWDLCRRRWPSAPGATTRSCSWRAPSAHACTISSMRWLPRGGGAQERARGALVARRGPDGVVLGPASFNRTGSPPQALRVDLRADRRGKPHPLKQELEQLLLAALGQLTGTVLAEARRRPWWWWSAPAMRARRVRDQRGAAPGEGRAQEPEGAGGRHRRRAAGECAGRARGGCRRRLHQLPPDRRRLRARACAHPRAQGARYGHSNLGARRARPGRVRLRQPDRSAARRPRPAGRLRRHAREPAGAPPATRSRASTTSTMPAGRWTSSR